jgi:hypothetical protein
MSILLHGYGISAACISLPATSGSSCSRLYFKFLTTAFRSHVVLSIRNVWRTVSMWSTTLSSSRSTIALFDFFMNISVIGQKHITANPDGPVGR